MDEAAMLPGTSLSEAPVTRRVPWNKGRLVGQKRPLKPKDVWGIRVRLEVSGSKRDLALFNLAIDSKLRGCIAMDDAMTISVQIEPQGRTRHPLHAGVAGRGREAYSG